MIIKRIHLFILSASLDEVFLCDMLRLRLLKLEGLMMQIPPQVSLYYDSVKCSDIVLNFVVRSILYANRPKHVILIKSTKFLTESRDTYLQYSVLHKSWEDWTPWMFVLIMNFNFS